MGSGEIYRIVKEGDEVRFHFVKLNGYDSKTNLNTALKANQMGTVKINSKSGKGTYQFAGKSPAILTCKEKYFIQLNPHTRGSGEMSDVDACKMLNEALGDNNKLKPEAKH